MSGLGHLAAGFAAKPATQKVPLWLLLIAAEANDILYLVFSSIGIEQKAEMSISLSGGIAYLVPAVNPWSHGLLMSVLWSLIAAGVGFLIYRDRRSTFLIGMVVFSHWLLDFIMHSNLPLSFDGSPLVGLGLENSGPGLILMTLFDLVILAAGLVFYFRARKQGQTVKGGVQ